MTTIPAQGDPASWPDHGPDQEDVRAWIAASLPGRPLVSGPTVVHRAHAWGLTARFRITEPDPADLVFKASFLPQTFSVSAPYRLLRQCGATGIPDLLAWTEEPGRRWLLFRAFRGTSAGDTPGIEPLVSVARTMARIQTLVAATPPATGRGLLGPDVSIGEIPAMLDRLIAMLRGSDPSPSGEETAIRLESGRDRVGAWVEELAEGHWPTSIHHVDLHPHNAVILANGAPLIYDWEEANLGFPFFSLEKLIQAAADRSPDGPTAVRAAYLDALPWHALPDRERAFALARRLSPIRFADADARFARALGWSEHDAVAPWIPLALKRWDEPN